MNTSSNSALRAHPVERVNVNLPRPLLDDLRRLVPRSRRSEVIARATAKELRRLKLAAAFQELAREPLWRAEHYPALNSAANIDASVRRMRTRGAWRFSRTPRAKYQRE